MSKIMLKISWMTIFIMMTMGILTHQSQISQNSPEPKLSKKSQSMEMSFDEYIVKYQKVYKNEEEKQQKWKIFESNVKKLKKSKCSACGINKFTDHSDTEIQGKNSYIKELRGFQRLQNSADTGISASGIVAATSSMEESTSNNNTNSSNSSIPKSFDWRDYGVITSVKNQQKCGVCWAFSTCAFFESELIRRGQAKSNTDLAEQYLYQCDSLSDGCKGGNLYSAMDLVLYGGIPFESTYPYSPQFGYPGICRIGRGPIFSFSQRTTVYNLTDAQVISYLLQRPLNIGIKSKNWEKYAPTDDDRTFECQEIKEGIKQYNHAVLLIGYTETEWIVKNQWGKDWGVDGYIYISRNPKQNCGIGLEINTLNYRLKPVTYNSQSDSKSTTNTSDDKNKVSNKTNANSTNSVSEIPSDSKIDSTQKYQIPKEINHTNLNKQNPKNLISEPVSATSQKKLIAPQNSLNNQINQINLTHKKNLKPSN